jgi:hypothetical protein
MAVSQQAMIISVRISDAEDIVALKSHIICSCSDHKFVSSWLITFVAQAQALYGSEAPPGQQFSILILQKSIYCHAKLIVYTEPNSYQRFKVRTLLFLSLIWKGISVLDKESDY